MEVGTLIALGAMVISLFGAVFKYIDRRRQNTKEHKNDVKRYADVERDSIVVRGAEGALLLMEKTLKTSNEECEKRIDELEEENEALKCELTELRQEVASVQKEMKELIRRVDNG